MYKGSNPAQAKINEILYSFILPVLEDAFKRLFFVPKCVEMEARTKDVGVEYSCNANLVSKVVNLSGFCGQPTANICYSVF